MYNRLHYAFCYYYIMPLSGFNPKRHHMCILLSKMYLCILNHQFPAVRNDTIIQSFTVTAQIYCFQKFRVNVRWFAARLIFSFSVFISTKLLRIFGCACGICISKICQTSILLMRLFPYVREGRGRGGGEGERCHYCSFCKDNAKIPVSGNNTQPQSNKLPL